MLYDHNLQIWSRAVGKFLDQIDYRQSHKACIRLIVKMQVLYGY